MDKYCFQYCQKIVVFSEQLDKILLCKRRNEKDLSGVYSFIGGKMETSDKSILAGLKREKDEEVGENFKIRIYTDYSTNLYFEKKDGSKMILPHYYAIHLKGDVKLSEEYSDYQWVPICQLKEFEPKIKNITDTVEIIKKIIGNISETNYEEI